MMKAIRLAVVVLGLGSLVAVMMHFGSAPASAIAPVPVQVTNAPLPVQGTVNANATILNTVPIAGSVSLAGNSRTTPVYVDTDLPARRGFGATCYIPDVDPSTNEATCSLLSLSSGQEAVVETVTCSALVAAGNLPGLELITVAPSLGGGGTVELDHFLALTKVWGDSSIELWKFASPLRIYVSGPGVSTGSLAVFFGSTYSASVRQNASCSISGYIVN
jgi:hypothetical protein